jgi:hypothetical protein
MEQLAKLLLENPELAREFFIPCCLWGLVEREDDEALILSVSRMPRGMKPSGKSIPL